MAEFLHTAYNFLGFYKTQSRFVYFVNFVNCLFFWLIISRARVTMHFQISFSLSCIRVYHTSHSISCRYRHHWNSVRWGGRKRSIESTTDIQLQGNLCLLPDLFYLLLFRLQHFCSTEPEKTLTSSVGSMQVSTGCELLSTISTVRFKVSARFTFISKVFSWSSTAST